MKNVWTLALALLLLIGWRVSGALAQESPHKRLSQPCEACHVATSWTDIHFDHSKTGFVLETRHERLSCTSCHKVEDFSRVEKTCSACHQDVHKARLGPDCQRCHTARGWELFDAEEIHSRTSFPLLGRHALIDCQSCHRGLPKGDLTLQATRCEQCHQQQYLEASNPDHVAGGLSTDCTECHQMNGWRPAFFPDHDAAFPIFSGSHARTWDDCTACHDQAGSFGTFSCFGCHTHNRTSMDRRHAGIGGYQYDSASCYSCHPSGSGEGGAQAHDASFFPIFSGTHKGAWTDCNACHVDPSSKAVFSCVDCHEHSQASTDPKHVGIQGYGFDSAQCYSCHPTGEKGEFRDHDNLYFPIFSGKHRGKWDRCQTCHNVPGNNAAFTCLDCHAHSRAKMDDKHQGEVQGYRYESSACYDCHRNGKGEND